MVPLLDSRESELAALRERLDEAELEEDRLKHIIKLTRIETQRERFRHLEAMRAFESAEQRAAALEARLAKAMGALSEVRDICHARSTGIRMSGERTYALPVIAKIAGVAGKVLVAADAREGETAL